MNIQVSVPRRGFRSLLPAGVDEAKRELKEFQSPEGDSGLCYWSSGIHATLPVRVSVPRRGFRSLLLLGRGVSHNDAISFSPPKGIQVFVTCRVPSGVPWAQGFSPPKGIQVFVTAYHFTYDVSFSGFQSPEGDSGLCYLNYYLNVAILLAGFSPPKGIQVFVTRNIKRRTKCQR